MLKLTLRQLEYAVQTADSGSVAAAADVLGVAQPSVSAALKKLEDTIGLQIFIRHHARGLTPTSGGVAFLADARRLIVQAEELARQVNLQTGPLKGRLQVGSFVTLAPTYAPILISEFNALYPGVEIVLEEGVQAELLSGLRHGQHDLALIYDVDLPADIGAIEVASLKPYVLLPASHKLARFKKISLSSLANDKLILLDIQPSRTYFLRLLEAQGVKPIIGFSSASLELVRGMVARGLGYSLLITRPAGDLSYDGEKLSVHEIAGPAERGVIAIAHLKNVRQTRVARVFEKFCVDYFKTVQK
jgi:DNA-binding transcriptional LysR family regulator